jgi:RNA polymerase sigma-70 factor, ECF subfamily
VDIEAVEAMAGSDGRVVAESELTLQAVVAALGRLPAEQRAVVALVCVEGASYKDAADITGVPIGTVMSRLARARRALNAALNQPEGTRIGKLARKTGS